MIDNIEIEKVNEIKFLGVVIDSKLSWKSHKQYITAKIAKSIAILQKVKYLLNQSSLYTLSCSFILPYITYCVEVWGNTYKTNTETIFRRQKRAIRIVNKSTCREPSNPLFIKLKEIQGFGRLQNNSNHAQSKSESVSTGHPKVVSNKRKQIQSQGNMHFQKTARTYQHKNTYISQRS